MLEHAAVRRCAPISPILDTELFVQRVEFAVAGRRVWPTLLELSELWGVTRLKVEMQELVPEKEPQCLGRKVGRVEQNVDTGIGRASNSRAMSSAALTW